MGTVPFRSRIWPALLLVWAALACGPAAAEPDLQEILSRLEASYRVPGFSARFLQASTIKAMEMTDTASGRVFVKNPDRMRWEYDTPEPQVIISDGLQIWIYRPEENQVMVGRAPDFFGGGRGAGFLADIGAIRENFTIQRAEEKAEGQYVLKLEPKQTQVDLAEVYVWIDRQTYRLTRILTYNGYGDETRIDLQGFQIEPALDNARFEFRVPEGTDVYRMGEE